MKWNKNFYKWVNHKIFISNLFGFNINPINLEINGNPHNTPSYKIRNEQSNVCIIKTVLKVSTLSQQSSFDFVFTSLWYILQKKNDTDRSMYYFLSQILKYAAVFLGDLILYQSILRISSLLKVRFVLGRSYTSNIYICIYLYVCVLRSWKLLTISMKAHIRFKAQTHRGACCTVHEHAALFRCVD